jgi:hypothetical protein
MTSSNIPGAQEPLDPISDIEQYLAQEADLDGQLGEAEYEARANADRAAALRAIIDQGAIDIATIDEKNYPNIEVLPLLDSEGALAHPFGDLVRNRRDLSNYFAGEKAATLHRKEHEALGVTANLLATIKSVIQGRLAEVYFTDYAILNMVGQYVHGLWSPENERLKKMSQATILRETDETTELGAASRERRLQALDILAPRGGYDFTQPLSGEELIEIVEDSGKHAEHVLNHQMRAIITAMLRVDPAEIPSDAQRLVFTRYGNHDNFSEFSRLVAIVSVDETGELADMFYDKISHLGEQMGIDEDQIWLEINVLSELVRRIKPNIASHDTE